MWWYNSPPDRNLDSGSALSTGWKLIVEISRLKSSRTASRSAAVTASGVLVSDMSGSFGSGVSRVEMIGAVCAGRAARATA